MSENCKGCLSESTCNAINTMNRVGFDPNNCPCGTCLIKGMCSTLCDDYSEHAKLQRLNYKQIGINEDRYERAKQIALRAKGEKKWLCWGNKNLKTNQ